MSARQGDCGMDQRPFAPWTRRRFLTRSVGLAAAAAVVPGGSVLLHSGRSVSASGTTPDVLSHVPLAPSTPLIDQVNMVCQRLAPEGWRNLLLAVSHDELDIAAADLSTMLSQP